LILIFESIFLNWGAIFLFLRSGKDLLKGELESDIGSLLVGNAICCGYSVPTSAFELELKVGKEL
jgi:hypothetical protein